MSEIITPVVYQLGLGAIGGFVVGFALKKIAKLFIIVLGIFIIALLYLGASNIININFGALWSAVGGWLGGAGEAASWLVGLVVGFSALVKRGKSPPEKRQTNEKIQTTPPSHEAASPAPPSQPPTALHNAPKLMFMMLLAPR